MKRAVKIAAALAVAAFISGRPAGAQTAPKAQATPKAQTTQKVKMAQGAQAGQNAQSGTQWTVGQLKVHWGLSHPQADSLLPKSKAPVVWPEGKIKRFIEPGLGKVGPGHYKLGKGWEMAEDGKAMASRGSMFDPGTDTNDWHEATVPGTVLTSLVSEGVFPDPYFGLNNLAIPDSLCRMDWWYRIEFDAPGEARGKNAELLFNGINYRAQVWLNGRRIGRIDGAFTRGRFDVTGLLEPDKPNVLVVKISPPHNPGIPQEQSVAAGQGANGGVLALDGPTFIASEGWDWIPGIRDRNSGIWQDVRLLLTNGVALGDARIVTDLPLPDTTRAAVSVYTQVRNLTSKEQKATVKGRIEKIEFSREVTIAPGKTVEVAFTPKDFPQLNMKNPRLWWPNGFGQPELYTLNLEASVGGKQSDWDKVRFGVREFSYEFTMDLPGEKDARVEYSPTDAMAGAPLIDNVNRRERPDKLWVPSLAKGADAAKFTKVTDRTLDPYLILKVNGQRVYVKGGNWGMDDAMKNSARERLEPAFVLHRDAGMNMVRNWTGETTQASFYELCDEYGMLVWNDFWLSTENYNLNVADDNLFLANAREVVRRFRNHASIVIWNPRNEGFAPAYIEEGLNKMIAAEDGTRHYHPNSQHMNLCKSGPWRYFKDHAYYYKDHGVGFTTEMGTPSVPTAETMAAMMAPEDLWPLGDVWAYHDLHAQHTRDYIADIAAKYGPSDGYEDFCRKAQMVNYDSHRAMFEAWNGRMWSKTSGFLLWMTHPAWPSTVWQIYSSDYETHAAYFGSKKACEPLHVQINPDGSVVAVNTTLADLKGATVKIELFDTKGKPLSKKEAKADIKANSAQKLFDMERPAPLSGVWLERVALTDAKGKAVTVNDYWRSADNNYLLFNTMGTAQVTGRIVSGKEGRLQIELTNTSKVAAVALKLNLREEATGKRILPAYFSDGYFNLLPGEKKTVYLHSAPEPGSAVSIEGYNVPAKNLLKI